MPQRIYTHIFKNRNPYRTTDTHNIRKPKANEPMTANGLRSGDLNLTKKKKKGDHVEF